MNEIIEFCTCGHTKNQHNPSRLLICYMVVLIEGHGDCKLCGCEKFTWHHNKTLPLRLQQ
ncbi:MAG: hypothetical protein ABSB40_12925 [Nitrososphaeria archaeon]